MAHQVFSMVVNSVLPESHVEVWKDSPVWAAEVFRSTLTVYSEASGQLVRSLSAGGMNTGMDAGSTVTCMTPEKSFHL